MNLYLLRHGDAIEQSYEDAARPLSPLGKEQARLAAHAFTVLNVALDAIFVSPLERAQQTAAIIEQELNLPKHATSELLLPGSDHLKFIDQLNKLAASNALLVGHEPHLSTLVSILINGKNYSHIAIKKGSLLFLEGPTPLERGKGSLRWMFTPEEMKYLQK